MKKTYIILLKNLHLIFVLKKPKKQGHFTKEVRLFSIDSNKNVSSVMEWVEKSHKHDDIKEIEDWE